ncbi:unnamed protein product [Linum trigynum]|uniref:Uncharacterized protein n=1 Tax=Linum trigynum TaxID=586398 RepID=A0AAV2F2V4_9ROSI
MTSQRLFNEINDPYTVLIEEEVPELMPKEVRAQTTHENRVIARYAGENELGRSANDEQRSFRGGTTRTNRQSSYTGVVRATTHADTKSGSRLSGTTPLAALQGTA